MNKKHFGINLKQAAINLEKKHPRLRVAIDQYKEKIEVACLVLICGKRTMSRVSVEKRPRSHKRAQLAGAVA